jgi:predicted alpha/beta superfamily hydrolase
MLEKSAARVEFPPVETHVITSRYIAQTFRVQVMQPGRKRGTRPRTPAVYFGDANWQFEMFKQISYLIQLNEQEAPPFMLVGIGYPGDAPHAGSYLRSRDFTFPGYPEIRRPPSDLEGVLYPEEGTKAFYGGLEFQQFLEHELIPFVEERYETEPGERTYFGHSAAGGFGLFTLFTRPHLFQNYIASSPGVTYDGQAPGGARYENYEFVLEDAQRFIVSRTALPGKKLYMSVGGSEEFQPYFENWRLTSSFYRLAALLKADRIPGLEFMAEVLPGETHFTVLPIAFIHGIQAVFGRRNIAG